MRIGIYYHARTDRKAGGEALFQEIIVEEIRKAGSAHEIFFFSPTAPTPFPADQERVHFIKLDTENKREGKAAETIKVAKRFISYGADALLDREFTHFSFLEKGVREQNIDLVWFISTSTEKVTVPYIATVWDLAHRVHPYFPEVSVTGWKWKMRERHYRELLPRAACVVAGTTAGKKEISSFYGVPEPLIEVVPFPTPPFALSSAISDAEQGEAEIPDNFLFYPAQFWPHKNHVGLLHALKLLREKHGLEFNLVLTGSDKGNLSYVKEQVAELGLEKWVTFPGFVSTGSLRNLYRRAFALLFPSFFGPDNFPPLEAFALGCPVIASDVPGAEEQLGEAALLFDPRQAEEIALRVKQLHDSPEQRTEMIYRGRQRAQAWTASDYVQRMLNIIDRFEPIRRCWSSREPYRHS